MKVNSLISLGAAVLFTACSSTDLYDPNAVQDAAKADYAANFVKKYAGVDLNQSWDFSTKQPWMGERTSIPAEWFTVVEQEEPAE